MIKIKTNFYEEHEGLGVFSIKKYDFKHTNNIEHVALIVFLMHQMMAQDEELKFNDIIKMIKDVESNREKYVWEIK